MMAMIGTARSRRVRTDHGFTAIELVISVLILGIIVLPLLASFVLSIGTTAEANQRTQNNADAQLVSSYFNKDVASSEHVAVSKPLTTSGVNAPPACGVTGDVVAQFDWPTSGVTRYVAYVVQPNADAQAEIKTTDGSSVPVYKLVRVYCENPSGPAGLTLTLANTLTQKPTLTCDGAPCATADAPNAMTAPPLTISLDLEEYARKASDPRFSFTVQGTRRVSS